MRRKIRATAAPPDPSITSRWQGRGRGWRPSQAKPSTIRGRNALTTFDSELGVAPGSFRSIHASVHHVSRRFANRPGADWGPFTLLLCDVPSELARRRPPRPDANLVDQSGKECRRKYKKRADINGDVPSPDRGSMGGATEEMDRYRSPRSAIDGGRVHLAFRRSSSLLC